MTKRSQSNAVEHNSEFAGTFDRSIVLIGMMGVGKSSVGKRLSEHLNMPFTDSDDEIEAAANMSIADIFERFGEKQFRDGERRVIRRLMNGPPSIIATGGGAFMQDETRALILDKAISIWLDADLDILIERLANRNHRPLLRGKSRAEIREFLIDLAATRNPLYAQADHHIMSNAAPHTATIKAIMKALKNG